MQNSQNRILIAFIIVAVIFGGVYLSGREKVTDAVEQLELEYSDFRIDQITLFPPSLDLTLTYGVINPSDVDLDISLDGDIYYGLIRISPLIVNEKSILANGVGTIEAQISLNGTLIQAIGDPENSGGYKLSGTMTVTGRYMGVLPISVVIDVSELAVEE